MHQRELGGNIGGSKEGNGGPGLGGWMYQQEITIVYVPRVTHCYYMHI